MDDRTKDFEELKEKTKDIEELKEKDLEQVAGGTDIPCDIPCDIPQAKTHRVEPR